MINIMTIKQELEKASKEIFRQRKLLYELLGETTQRKEVLACFPKSYLLESEKEKCFEEIKADFFGEENLVALHGKFLLKDELVEVVNKIAAIDCDSYRKIAYSDWDCVFEGKVFEFTDVVLLDDRSFQKVLRSVSMETIVVSMIGESHAVKDKFYRNVSRCVASEIKKLMCKKMKVVEQHDVLKKQGLILMAIHKLIKQGEILFPGELDYDC